MARRVFFSFNYRDDAMRTQQIRQIGALDGNKPVGSNDWESIKRGGDAAIKRWIDSEMYHKSCAVVLIGQNTANRPWINYEIEKAWNDGKGVVGIYIHKLNCPNGGQCSQGRNPLDFVHIDGSPLSAVAQAHNPPHFLSKEAHGYISDNIARWVDEAVDLRKNYRPRQRQSSF